MLSAVGVCLCEIPEMTDQRASDRRGINPVFAPLDLFLQRRQLVLPILVHNLLKASAQPDSGSIGS